MNYVSSKDHFRRYPKLITALYNIHHHVKNLKYDYPLVICGKTGNGKSMLLLHIVDLWYNLILEEKLTREHIKHVQNTRKGWILNFKLIIPLDFNANDEGSDGLMSNESMTKFGRDIQKLYNVFRKKLFITPILIPNFFSLPLYFRERVRGVIWVNKRGHFKYYSGLGIEYLNSYNENKQIKSMTRAYPLFTGVFPDYNGVLRAPYDEQASNSPDSILDGLISELDSGENTATIFHEKIRDLILDGKKQKEICSICGVSPRIITQVRKKMMLLNEFDT